MMATSALQTQPNGLLGNAARSHIPPFSQGFQGIHCPTGLYSAAATGSYSYYPLNTSMNGQVGDGSQVPTAPR